MNPERAAEFAVARAFAAKLADVFELDGGRYGPSVGEKVAAHFFRDSWQGGSKHQICDAYGQGN